MSLPCGGEKRHDASLCRIGSSSQAISRKPDGGLGWVLALDLEGRMIWVADAHGYGKRFVVRADEKLTAFVELQAAIHRRFEAQLESHA